MWRSGNSKFFNTDWRNMCKEDRTNHTAGPSLPPGGYTPATFGIGSGIVTKHKIWKSGPNGKTHKAGRSLFTDTCTIPGRGVLRSLQPDVYTCSDTVGSFSSGASIACTMRMKQKVANTSCVQPSYQIPYRHTRSDRRIPYGEVTNGAVQDWTW